MSEYTESVKFIDLASQQKLIRKNIDDAVQKVLDHGVYIMGPEVKQFENELSIYTGSKHVMSCANGTDALTIALMTWNIGKGDAVFVPSFTYVGTAEAPAILGATPFFVDVEEDTFNISITSLKQAIIDAKKLGFKASAVIPVDLFGRPADIDAINEIAHENNMHVLVDAAQSFGARLNGRFVGSMGDITTTSFFPAKPLGCYGDGGAIFTSNDEYAEIINSIRLHGKGSEKYDNVRVGMNSRLDTIQAAILLEKLKLLPKEIELRNAVAKNYDFHLSHNLKKPIIPDNILSAWAQYTVISNNRDVDAKRFNDAGIPTVIYYPKSLTQQEAYKKYPVVSGGTLVSDNLSSRVFSLPMYPYLDIDKMKSKILQNEL